MSLVVIVIIVFAAMYVYKKFLKGIDLKDKNYTYIYIGKNDSFEDVMNSINSEDIIENPTAFSWLAKEMDLEKNINPGKYRIIDGMNMRQIINLIKYNKQEKVKLTFNSQIHNLDEFVEYVDDKLELSNSELEDVLTDEKKLREWFKLDPDNSFALIIPGVYELSWAVSTDDFFKILKEKFNKVWNSTRLAQAKKLGYKVSEIITMASIVQNESAIESEQEKIAGVYFNRLKKGMRLEADPTLKFANKNFGVKRVYNIDKEINSPYNTYRYKGLPPGPISLVNTQALDATLNYNKHNFIFFCAKPQLNGFSDFSSTYDQHRRFASAYQKAMNKKGIGR
ncbi:endolytic transglycosylase MltG [Aurantibacillus circumpalustris]|uniref:endolytic transglycosylase MltG n=1 Tax=Aurantibacillus circumpalustris TaxID=3036359 RepID=UPI00295B2FB7|nr:endolytic transglycosylase MltG [Aurantibacillus circumpalustris]